MTYLIARRGKIIKVYDVREIKSTAVEWLIIKINGTIEVHSKYTTDILGKI